MPVCAPCGAQWEPCRTRRLTPPPPLHATFAMDAQMDTASVLRDAAHATEAERATAPPAIEVSNGTFTWPHVDPLPLESKNKSLGCCFCCRRRATGAQRGGRGAGGAGGAGDGVELAPLGGGGGLAGSDEARQALAVENGESTSGAPCTLQGVNLRIQPGELVCIVGQVASGKSSLLHAILGEMEKRTGGCRRVCGCAGRVSPCAAFGRVARAVRCGGRRGW